MSAARKTWAICLFVVGDLLAPAARQAPSFDQLFQRYRGAMIWTSRIAGVLLIGVGVLMLTDTMRLLSQWLNPYTPEFLRSRL